MQEVGSCAIKVYFCSSSFYCFSHCSLSSFPALERHPQAKGPLGVQLPWHGFPTAAVPWGCCCLSMGHPGLQSLLPQSVFPATFPVLHILPLVAGTGMLKRLLNLPEVFGGDGLFMLVSEASGISCGHLRAACHTGHLCNPLPPNPCSRCPICSCTLQVFPILF